MSKQRVPLQVAPEFEKKLKSLQKKIMMKQGKNVSLRDLTEKISKTTDFERLEQTILKNPSIDIKINLDMRGKNDKR